jgi:hypothetical protein
MEEERSRGVVTAGPAPEAHSPEGLQVKVTLWFCPDRDNDHADPLCFNLLCNANAIQTPGFIKVSVSNYTSHHLCTIKTSGWKIFAY